MEVDEKRKRIALTMRLTDSAPQADGKTEPRDRNGAKRPSQQQQVRPQSGANSAMAAAFAKLKV